MGSVTHVVDSENKEILNRYEYDAWGNSTLCEEKVPNRFLFNGQQYDQTTQQYYLRARCYNPVIARFTQEDTYRGDGLNLYAYCANNPVSYVDPSGYAKKEYGRDHTTNLAHESHETVTAGEGRRAGDNRSGRRTNVELNSFGNASRPRGARPKDFGVNSMDDMVGPEMPPLPNGASNAADVNLAPLKGHYHKLPAGTELPDGLDDVADGSDVIPNSERFPRHHTIFPTREMTVNEFNELYLSLPWEHGGKKP